MRLRSCFACLVVFRPGSAGFIGAAGCWEVTGRVGEASLTFVTMVTKIGDGPAWRWTPLR